MDQQSNDARPLGFLERSCPVRTAIGVIAGKWKPSILRGIYAGRRRYSELRGEIAGISDQTLTRHLRELCADGAIEREAEGAAYRLTPHGEELGAILEALEQWGEAYLIRRKGAGA